MKEILVCADFSAASRHCARYALLLANALKTNLILLHAIPTGQDHSPPLLFEPVEVLEGRALEMLCDLRLLLEADLSKSLHAQNTPSIAVSVCLGNLQEIIANMYSSKLISMACLGIGSKRGSMVLMPESTISPTRKSVAAPLIYVPLNAALLLPAKIALFVDLPRPGSLALSFMTAFCTMVEKVIILICPSPERWLSDPLKEDEKLLNSFLKGIPLQKISYLHIKERNAREMGFLVRTNGVGMVLLQGPKVDKEKTYNKTTRKLIFDMGIPVILFSP